MSNFQFNHNFFNFLFVVVCSFFFWCVLYADLFDSIFLFVFFFFISSFYLIANFTSKRIVIICMLIANFAWKMARHIFRAQILFGHSFSLIAFIIGQRPFGIRSYRMFAMPLNINKNGCYQNKWYIAVLLIVLFNFFLLRFCAFRSHHVKR